MENRFFSGEKMWSLEDIENEKRIRERLQSLQGMILKGGEQGEKAKKVLIREFGQQVMGFIVELQREAKKNKK